MINKAFHVTINIIYALIGTFIMVVAMIYSPAGLPSVLLSGVLLIKAGSCPGLEAVALCGTRQGTARRGSSRGKGSESP